MVRKRQWSGGYIGLLMLLFGVAIIAFIIVRTDLLTSEKNDTNVI